MISGECRVEPIGLSTSRRLALDGLRLQLDLRIVPDTKGEGVVAAAWRVEEAGVETLRLGVPARLQRGAMLAGIGVLALALIVWFAGSRSPTNEDTAGASSAGASSAGALGAAGAPTNARPPTASEHGGAASIEPGLASGSEGSGAPGPAQRPAVAPHVAPVPVESAASAPPSLMAPCAPAAPEAAAASAAAAAGPPPHRAELAFAGSSRAASRSLAAAPTTSAARGDASVRHDLLDLFNDTK